MSLLKILGIAILVLLTVMFFVILEGWIIYKLWNIIIPIYPITLVKGVAASLLTTVLSFKFRWEYPTKK